MHPGDQRDARVLVAEADRHEGDPGQHHRGEQEGGGHDLGRPRPDQAAEQAGDRGAEQRQEDDGLIHAAHPRITLMSSTSIEPRLRK